VKHRIRLGDLRMLLREELTGDETPDEMNDSLDSQVDRYLAKYESDSKPSKLESVDHRLMTRKFLIEADEDQDELPTTDEPTKLSSDDIDVESFVDNVVRLIENYDSLLEVRSTLVRRAKNFLVKSYDADVIKSFEDTLRETHGIIAGETKKSVSDDQFQPPPADRAGDGGAGGAPA
jgi:hypothetical protein